MKKITALLMTLVLLLTCCACRQQKKRYEAQFLQLFDTLTTVVAYMDSKDEFSKLSTMIYDTLNEYHQLFDIYHDYEGINNIKTINDNAGKQPIKVDRRIIELLLFSKEAYTRTNGKCNIALGSVLKIWHYYREEGINDPENSKLPSQVQLIEAAKHTDINNLIIDKKNSTAYLTDQYMSLDVGAVAKGYATEETAKKAKENGYNFALLSVGGNVRAIGSKEESGQPWNIGIQDPDKQNGNRELMITHVSDKSVVTSGIYERYYTVNEKNYHHIIDPDTLMPSDYFKSVTIICNDWGIADELSTAVFNMSYEQGIILINSLPYAEAIWVMPDNEIKYSENFKEYIKP